MAAQGTSKDKASWKAMQLPFDAIMALSDQRRCYQISERTAGMFLSQAEYFFWSTRWSYDGDLTPEMKEDMQSAANKAVFELMQFDDCAGCNDYFPNSSIIEFSPNDPYEDPPGDYTPGYPFPPFYVVDEFSLPTLLGAQLGDVLTDFTRISANPFDWGDVVSRGLPRFRVTFEGEGEIEVHLLKVPLGGLAYITVDDNPLTGKIMFLNSISVLDFGTAIASLLDTFLVDVGEPIFIADEIAEFQVLGGGEHHLDVTFLPQVGSDTLLGFGGGLRKITLCGLTVSEEDCDDMDVRQNEETPCILEKLVDDVWTPFANLRLCPPMLRTVGGVTQVSTDEGETWTDVDSEPPPIPVREGDNGDCLAAANAVEVLRTLHFETVGKVAVATELGVALFIIGILAGLIFTTVFLAAILPVVVGVGGLFALATEFDRDEFDTDVHDYLLCLFRCHEIVTDGVITFDFSAIQAGVTSQIGGNGFYALLLHYVNILGEDGLNQAGATTSITEADCSACPCEEQWCYKFDFRDNDGGWIPHSAGLGTWVSGQGWQSEVFGGTSPALLIRGALDFPNSFRTVIVEYSQAATDGVHGMGFYDGSYTSFMISQHISNGSDLVTNAIHNTTTVEGSEVYYNWNEAITPASNTFTLHSLTFMGDFNGNPFGEDNCEYEG